MQGVCLYDDVLQLLT